MSQLNDIKILPTSALFEHYLIRTVIYQFMLIFATAQIMLEHLRLLFAIYSFLSSGQHRSCQVGSG